MKNKKIFFPILLLILFSCNNKKENESPYKIINSGVWAKPDYERSEIYWLDEENILFAGQRTIIFTPGEKENTLLVWNYKNNSVYPVKGGSMNYCYKNGKLLYGKRLDINDKNSWRTFSSDLKKDKGEYRISNVSQLDEQYTKDGNCNIKLRPSSEEYVKAFNLEEFGFSIRPIEDEAIKYVKNPNLGAYNGNELLKIFPIRLYGIHDQPTYYKFKNAYYIRSRYQIENSGKAGGQWPQNFPRKDYWLYEDLTLEEIIWPSTWVKVNTSPTVMSQLGLIVFGRDLSLKNSTLDDYGMFLIGANTTSLIRGLVTGIAVSLDGCKVVFSHVSNGKYDLHNQKNQRTLKLINLCK